MDIYITKIETGESVRIPLLPDSVSAKDRTNMISLAIIALGEVKIPRGSKLSEYSWKGVFPGEHMKNMSFLREWAKPQDYIARLRTWRSNGDKLRLMITETPVNADVYLDSFSFEARGGMGDYDYSISFVDCRTVTVSTVQEAGIETDTLSKMISAHYVAIRPASITSKYITHTVVLGDTLYTIAKKYLGDGARWEEIYKLNQEMIDAANKGRNVSRDTIYVGQVLLVKEKPAEPVATPTQSYSSGGGSSSSSSSSSSKKSSSSSKKTTTTSVSTYGETRARLTTAAIAATSAARKNASSSTSTASKVVSAIKKVVSSITSKK